MKGVQCYEFFGRIAHKNHAFLTISVRRDSEMNHMNQLRSCSSTYTLPNTVLKEFGDSKKYCSATSTAQSTSAAC